MTAAPAQSWRCRCGQTFTAYAPAERHARVSGHGRVAVVLPGVGDTGEAP